MRRAVRDTPDTARAARAAQAARPRVLVTRPREQAARLIDGVRRLGFEPVPLPCLDIEPVPLPRAPCPHRGVAIFTSRNAVEHAVARDGWPWHGVPALAIGAATAEALVASGCAPALAPREPFDTEALLDQLDALPAMAGEDARAAAVLARLGAGVTIVTGEGGRPTLADTLRERGHTVQRRELYRRCTSRPTATELEVALRPMPDVVSASSDAVLDALVRIVPTARAGQQRLERLRCLPLLVNGERCAAHARYRGFSGPLLVARPAGDAGQLAALVRWHAEPRAR